MIEEQLERIANALEKIAERCGDVLNGRGADAPVAAPAVTDPLAGAAAAAPKAPRAPKAPTKAAGTTAAPVDPAPAPTMDDLIALLREFVKNKGSAAAKEVLGKYGVERISGVAPKDYANIAKDLKS